MESSTYHEQLQLQVASGSIGEASGENIDNTSASGSVTATPWSVSIRKMRAIPPPVEIS